MLKRKRPAPAYSFTRSSTGQIDDSAYARHILYRQSEGVAGQADSGLTERL